jgi:hypothetical protein
MSKPRHLLRALLAGSLVGGALPGRVASQEAAPDTIESGLLFGAEGVVGSTRHAWSRPSVFVLLGAGAGVAAAALFHALRDREVEGAPWTVWVVIGPSVPGAGTGSGGGAIGGGGSGGGGSGVESTAGGASGGASGGTSGGASGGSSAGTSGGTSGGASGGGSGGAEGTRVAPGAPTPPTGLVSPGSAPGPPAPAGQSVAVVPEPATAALTATGLALLAARVRSGRRRARLGLRPRADDRPPHRGEGELRLVVDHPPLVGVLLREHAGDDARLEPEE